MMLDIDVKFSGNIYKILKRSHLLKNCIYQDLFFSFSPPLTVNL